jgi:hypothetical protein
MFVSTAMLHSGAAGSYRAGEHAHDGANHLSGRSPVAGMFGDFAAAEAFHAAVSSVHACHVKTLKNHQESLGDVGAKTHLVAYSFSVMEDDNAEALRDV